MNKKLFTIREFGFFYKETSNINIERLSTEGHVALSDEAFDYLETFILSNYDEHEYFMQIAYKKGIGKIIKAKNYVGTIQTPNGIVIEILPKIYFRDENMTINNTKKLLINMLKHTRDIPFKNFSMSNLGTTDGNILDVFINMFLDEVSNLIKKTLKSSYVQEEDNLNYLKGKLLLDKHIVRNSIRKDKFYVQFDEYSNNIPENRILKSTLLKLSNITSNSKIQNRIRTYLFAFLEIQPSINYKMDFAKCTSNRLMQDYKLCLEWSKIFLENKGFNIYTGESKAYSLLYPMDRVFESYIANNILKSDLFSEFDVIIQAKKHTAKYLFDYPKKFKLKPDIIIKSEEGTIIFDTKWKSLYNDSNKNYGISQLDMYQMYAYAKKYGANKVILIYPYSEESKCIMENHNYNELMYKSNDGVYIQLFFFKLECVKDSLYELKKLLY